MKQVITIAPDGAMSGLQMKPGKGVDLRQFGKADIKRVSEILWSAQAQKWYIEGVTGHLKGHIFRHDDYWGVRRMNRLAREVKKAYGGVAAWAPGADPMQVPHGIMLFDNYDHAVAAEIVTLNRFRKEDGIFDGKA